jgi:hypothetical protein
VIQLAFPKLVGLDRICLVQRSITKRATNEIDPVARSYIFIPLQNFTSPFAYETAKKFNEKMTRGFSTSVGT